MTENRALRYRKLAMAEQDPATAKLLRQIADETEQGVLCIPERRTDQTTALVSVEAKI